MKSLTSTSIAKTRCSWPHLESSEIYIRYHDEEWGVPSYDDAHLFEMFILESFHCGLSWLLILKKRAAFKQAFDNFDPHIMAGYDAEKITELMQNTAIVRNKAKIMAAIANAKSYLRVIQEFDSFTQYIWSFTEGKIVYEPHDGTLKHNALSDRFAKDVKKRGFKFMGTVTAFSYLEAVGVMNNHSCTCFKYVPVNQH